MSHRELFQLLLYILNREVIHINYPELQLTALSKSRVEGKEGFIVQTLNHLPA